MQGYYSLNGSDGNPNITECDTNGSLCTLVRTQKTLVKCATFIDYGRQIKHQTQTKIYFSQRCCLYLHIKIITEVFSTDIYFLYIINKLHDEGV